MNVLKELSASQYSIDLDFLPDTENYINFVPRKSPDLDQVVNDAEFLSLNPKEDLESAYYRCFNWIHVETCNRYIGVFGVVIALFAILFDLGVTGPSLLSIPLAIHLLTLACTCYGSLFKSPKFYLAHVIFGGFTSIVYFIMALVFIFASLIITGSMTIKDRATWDIDSRTYLQNGICLSVVALVLYYSVNISYRDFEYLTRALTNRSAFIFWQY